MASKTSTTENKAAGATPEKKLPSALAAVLAQIRKEYGDGAITQLGAAQTHEVPCISTGALTLDIALGIGGIPRGRIVEVFGPESSGKTTLVLHIIAQAQRQGGVAAFIDAEHALDPSYARRIGVNLDELLVSQPDSGEEALNIAEQLVRSNSLDVVVVDSVAALAPKAELEGQMGDSYVGLQARLMSQAMRKLTGALARSRCACVFTNQIREKIGVMFGNPETTPGGRALKFYASVRLDVRRVNTLKDASGAAIGSRTKVKVVKNKLAPPFAEAEFDILYSEGISWTGSIVDAAMQYDLLEKRGSWLSFEGRQIGQGRDAAVAELRNNAELQSQMVERIWAKVRQSAAK